MFSFTNRNYWRRDGWIWSRSFRTELTRIQVMEVLNLASQLVPTKSLESKPLKGLRVGVSLPSFFSRVTTYYIFSFILIILNLSLCDAVRYGNQVSAEELSSLYGASRANGVGPEV
ncbi:hypothetical protein IFM89_006812 [Coptis chinensis]|uniref:Uncharacterized protein n=1 Tax=Coptis chinensis TaxID=261450 RepID=A0A835IBH4_9MAGN|nr:hypothetical protein IFM89_006812 [Coptis chinensis]